MYKTIISPALFQISDNGFCVEYDMAEHTINFYFLKLPLQWFTYKYFIHTNLYLNTILQ